MTSVGGAGYRVTNVATGSVLTESSCRSGKTLPGCGCVRRTGRTRACSTWTLVPGNDGTWSLATAGRSQTVRLLIP